MSASDPSHHDQSARERDVTERRSSRDPSAVPTFLREPERRRRTDLPDPPNEPRAAMLPRPVTPPQPPAAERQPRIDPTTLPMPSLSRRRVVTVAGVLLAGWLVLSFVRQVGEAAAASDRAAELRAANAALHDEVARLQADLTHVQDDRYIRLEGRAYGLGGRGELPFALAADAPSLPPDAPGSASVRLGVEPRPAGPIEAWLEVLFGAGP
jgi:hypothetical protein